MNSSDKKKQMCVWVTGETNKEWNFWCMIDPIPHPILISFEFALDIR